MHIESEELVSSKIAALQGKGSRNNKLVLKILALGGPLIKYDIFKALKSEGIRNYPTISRRVDDLKRRGYLENAGTRLIRVGKRVEESHTYGLRWRGFIACLAIGDARENLIRVLENNHLLEKVLPNSVSKQIIIDILKELFSQEELETISRGILEGYLMAIPENLEWINEGELVAYIVPALIKSSSVWTLISKKDLSKLLSIKGLPELLLTMTTGFEMQLNQSLEAIKVLKGQLNQYVATGREQLR
jgi:hypothetical protein